jgi:hypothetical protein
MSTYNLDAQQTQRVILVFGSSSLEVNLSYDNVSQHDSFCVINDSARLE